MQTMQTESPKRVKPFVPDFEVVLPHTHMRLEHCISTGATRSVWVGRDGKQHRRWLVKNYESATWFGLMGELVGYTKLTELPLCMRGRVVVRRQLSDRCRNWLPNEELGS
jgi:hypothetical protein